ncbi:MAG TPA: DUF411 domain-containing protein [Steroidobacteraceae bacterium]|nr:DUF411 domain-containing protein [Steroidobacteraceae bacterium]
MRNFLPIALLVLVGVAVAQEPTRPAAQKSEAAKKAELPLLIVHKSESCGCCEVWVRHMEQAGFKVEVHNEKNLDPIKRAMGVPANGESCHTAKIDRYFIEGHVPAEDVKRMLAERPNARGLTVPGMPIGSPGMEQGNRRDPYDVLLVQRSGKTSVYAHHGD